MKSANQMWRESKTTLSFKNWIAREKEKYSSFTGDSDTLMIPNKLLNEMIFKNKPVPDTTQNVQPKGETDKGKTFGISNIILIVSVALIAGAIVYSIQKNKSE